MLFVLVFFPFWIKKEERQEGKERFQQEKEKEAVRERSTERGGRGKTEAPASGIFI